MSDSYSNVMRIHKTRLRKKSSIYFLFFVLCCYIWLVRVEAMSCDSCGGECASACGTKHFRTCCFNYLKKRSGVIRYVDPTEFEGYPYIKFNDISNSKEAEEDHHSVESDKMATEDKRRFSDRPLVYF